MPIDGVVRRRWTEIDDRGRSAEKDQLPMKRDRGWNLGVVEASTLVRVEKERSFIE